MQPSGKYVESNGRRRNGDSKAENGRYRAQAVRFTRERPLTDSFAQAFSRFPLDTMNLQSFELSGKVDAGESVPERPESVKVGNVPFESNAQINQLIEMLLSGSI